MSGFDSAGTTAVLVLLAIALGSGLAQLLPGKPRPRRRPPLAGVGLLGAGVGARLAVELFNVPGGLVVLIASYGLLVAACLLNLSRAGTPVVALGLVVMLGPTVVNDGMPVSSDALASMGMNPTPASLPGERHVEVERDQLRVLGDVLPLPFGGRPVSFGELIALVGLADVAFHGVGRRTRRRGAHFAPGHRPDPSLVLEEPIDDGGEPSVVVLGPVSSTAADPPAGTPTTGATGAARSTRSVPADRGVRAARRSEQTSPTASGTEAARRLDAASPARRDAAVRSTQSFWSDPFSNDPFETDPFSPDESWSGVFSDDRERSVSAGQRDGPRRP